MKLLVIYLLAFTGGIFLAVQAGFNTQLGTALKQPIIAVIATSITSALLGGLFFLFFNTNNINLQIIHTIPWYLWFVGGLFSMAGISLYFYTIPKLGISKMIAMGLCGQLLFSLVAGNFGWLNLPKEPITLQKIIGTIAMVMGIILINIK